MPVNEPRIDFLLGPSLPQQLTAEQEADMARYYRVIGEPIRESLKQLQQLLRKIEHAEQLSRR